MEEYLPTGPISLAEALRFEDCPDKPQIFTRTADDHKVESLLYSCGLLIDIHFSRYTQSHIVTPVAAAHILHHLEKHQPILPMYTINLQQIGRSEQYRAWCRDCFHMRQVDQ